MTLTVFKAQAADNCRELFSIDQEVLLKETQDNLETSDGLNRQMDIWINASHANIAQKPAIILEMLNLASENLARQGVEYTINEFEGNLTILIHPSPATPLNNYALKIQENYNAELRFIPEGLLDGEAVAWILPSGRTKGINQGRSHSVFALNWENISSNFNELRFLRDITLLHEMRHLKLQKELYEGVHLPFYGRLVMDTPLPGVSKSVDQDVYQHTFSFSEIKTHHSELKQLLVGARDLVRNQASTNQQIEKQFGLINNALKTLKSVSSRSQIATDLLIQPATTGYAKVLLEKLIGGPYNAYIIYLDPAGTQFVMIVPIVRVKSKNNANIPKHIDNQVLWIHQTAASALKQATAARTILNRIGVAKNQADLLHIIDDMQAALGVHTLVPVEPN